MFKKFFNDTLLDCKFETGKHYHTDVYANFTEELYSTHEILTQYYKDFLVVRDNIANNVIVE